MTPNASVLDSQDRERLYRARLKDEPLPGAVIDCATAEVLAANAGGLNALGLTPADRLPAGLDSAMPAIAVLRQLQGQGITAPQHSTLVFWRYGRTSTRLCEISCVGDAKVGHLIVLFRPDDTDAADAAPQTLPAASAPVAPLASAANDDTPARIERDDGETLKEIAKRIREGHSVGPSPIQPTAIATVTEPPQTTPNAPLDLIGSSASAEPSPWDRPRALHPPHTQRNFVRTLPPEDIANLAHELKTPLSAIAAAAEIMRDETLGAMGNDKYLGYAADIHESATHALAVISEMLHASPPDFDRAANGEAFDLTDLADKTVSALQPLAQQRSLTLGLEADHTLMPVRANATAIRQILLNLLTNALKFTPAGGDVRVVTGYLDDGAIFCVVRDTGDGMSDDAIAYAFDDGPETLVARPGGGRGIGLRLVRRLATENGCAFEIDSAPAQGTVVLIAFPKDLVGER